MIYVKVAVIPPPSFVPSLWGPEYFLPPALEVELVGNKSIFGGRGKQKLLLGTSSFLVTQELVPSAERCGVCLESKSNLG